MEAAGVWKLIVPSFMPMFRRLFQRDLDNLKRMMEAGQL
jgi:hypothetical protein